MFFVFVGHCILTCVATTFITSFLFDLCIVLPVCVFFEFCPRILRASLSCFFWSTSSFVLACRFSVSVLSSVHCRSERCARNDEFTALEQPTYPGCCWRQADERYHVFEPIRHHYIQIGGGHVTRLLRAMPELMIFIKVRRWRVIHVKILC